MSKLSKAENMRKDFTKQAIAYLDMTGNPEYYSAVKKTFEKCEYLEKKVDFLESKLDRIEQIIEEVREVENERKTES